jgi:hypothetical protein
MASGHPERPGTGLVGTIDAALRATFLISNEIMASQAETLHVHLGVFESVCMRDPVGARRAMNSLLNYAANDLDITDQLIPSEMIVSPGVPINEFMETPGKASAPGMKRWVFAVKVVFPDD